MSNTLQLTFKLVEKKDRTLIRNWLAKPHVTKWFYGKGLDNTYQHLDEFIAGTAGANYWLTYDSIIPFAFLITSLVKKPDDKLSRWCIATGTTITLDMLIGDEKYLGKGFAFALIKEFFLSKFSNVEEVLIDPEATNTRAIHVYKKVGFTILDQFIPSHSPYPHYMMRLNMQKLKRI